MNLRKTAWIMGFCGVSAIRCVGDNTVLPDSGGPDSTVADAANDNVVPDGQANDGGQDGDASSSGPHVYATNFGNPNTGGGGLFVFDQPITNTSTPTAIVTANFKNPTDVEYMPGNAQIIVTDVGASKLFIFNLPITSSSTPVITASTGSFQPVDGAFDQQGNFWMVGYGNAVERFASPITSSSTAAQSFTMPVADAFGVAINPSNNVVVSATGHLYVFNQPIEAGAPSPNIDNTQVPNVGTGIAFGTNQEFVSVLQSGDVYMFDGGLSSGKTPTAVGAGVLSQPARLKVNSLGNLVVADATKGLVVLQAPSFNTAGVTLAAQGADAGVNFRAVLLGP